MAAIVAVVWLDDAGFCFSQRLFLSDPEKIRTAASYTAQRGFHFDFRVDRGEGTGAEIMVRTPGYGSPADLMAANPGCRRMAGPEDTGKLRHPEWADERRHRRPERSGAWS